MTDVAAPQEVPSASGATPGCTPWPVPPSCGWPPDAPVGTDAAEWDALVAAAWEVATNVVWGLTGRRFGVCTRTAEFALTAERTCLPSPVLWRGEWFNWYSEPPMCCALRLPGPVLSVDEVLVDGQPFTDWALDGDRLINLDGCWPPQWPCEPAVLVVTWTGGVEPTLLACQASAELAKEVIAPCRGELCRLPSNMTSITRLGVTVTFGDPNTLITAGLTGLSLVDLAIRTYNPARLAQRSGVYSPDVPRPRYRLPRP